MDSETEEERKKAAGNPGESPGKSVSGPMQLIIFIFIFIASLTFLFYVIGIYDLQ